MSWSGGAIWKPEIEKAEQESGSARRSLSLAPCPPLQVQCTAGSARRGGSLPAARRGHSFPWRPAESAHRSTQ